MSKKLRELLPNEIIKKDYLKNYTTFRIGGRATIIEVRSQSELEETALALSKEGIKFMIVGNGSNLLCSSLPHKKVFIVTALMADEFILEGQRVTVSSGTNINQLIRYAEKHELSGLENLFGIPATVGGMIVMNAGAFGSEVFDHLVSIKVLKDGRVQTLQASMIKRETHCTELLNSGVVVLSATFDLEPKPFEVIDETINRITKQRLEKQPKGNSAGCVFRNPVGDSAGRLIDAAGLKGSKCFRAYVSEKHANFIISNRASSWQVVRLIKRVQSKVYKKFGVRLKPEIEYVGD